MCIIYFTKLIVSDQKEESISIKRVYEWIHENDKHVAGFSG